jgi:hypothetical protein
MSEFNIPMTVDNIRYQFTFTRIQSPLAEKYFVTANNFLSDPFSFEMKKDEAANWKVIMPAPEWAMEIEQKLAVAIESNLP